MTQYSLLAVFFWLNVLCFDIRETFVKEKLPSELKSKKKFKFYCLYAWGCPLLVSVVTILADTILEDEMHWKPGLGKQEGVCWFQKNNCDSGK